MDTSETKSCDLVSVSDLVSELHNKVPALKFLNIIFTWLLIAEHVCVRH